MISRGHVKFKMGLAANNHSYQCIGGCRQPSADRIRSGQAWESSSPETLYLAIQNLGQRDRPLSFDVTNLLCRRPLVREQPCIHRCFECRQQIPFGCLGNRSNINSNSKPSAIRRAFDLDEFGNVVTIFVDGPGLGRAGTTLVASPWPQHRIDQFLDSAPKPERIRPASGRYDPVSPGISPGLRFFRQFLRA